jgi:RHS repeat-associated protein
MVALNEKFSHCGNLVSEGRVSPDEIDAFDFTKRSEEVHGGFVVICGVAGFCGLFDASPLRRNSAAPLNQSGPETQLYYVRNRTYSPGIGRWIQRDPIGYSGGINLFEYVGGRAVVAVDPEGNRLLARAPSLSYRITCAIATAAYQRGCSAQSAGCSCPTSPWPCCAAGVSLEICTLIEGGVPLPLPGPCGLPLEPCFLGCVNWCLYLRWRDKSTPAWRAYRRTCHKGGNCSANCCYQGVIAEQLGVSECAPACAAQCGLAPGTLAGVINGLQCRLNYGYQKCCGAA